MNNPLKPPNAEKRAQETFFALLMAGYAANTEPEKIQRFAGDEGTKRNTWGPISDWHGIDEWRTTPIGNGSNGTTSIYYKDCLVWEMQYGGSYPDNAIPFLKKALRQTYSKKLWVGGRGPGIFESERWDYVNIPDDVDSSFIEFSGNECVAEHHGDGPVIIGSHTYRGGFLFEM